MCMHIFGGLFLQIFSHAEISAILWVEYTFWLGALYVIKLALWWEQSGILVIQICWGKQL